MPVFDGREFSPEQQAALKDLAAGTGDALALARVLRPMAQDLEVLLWQLAATSPVPQSVSTLLRLSDPAFAMVEDGRASADWGNRVARDADVALQGLPPESRAAFETKALMALADDTDFTTAEIIAKVANEIRTAWNEEQERLECERAAQSRWWSWGNTLSWILRREPSELLAIKAPESRRERFYFGTAHEEPERLLLAGLSAGKLKAHKAGAELSASYWAGKTAVDRDAHFEAEEVRRIWPRWLTWNEAIEVVGGHYAAAGQRLVDLLPLNILDLHALVRTGNPSNPRMRVRVVEVKPGATTTAVTVVIADDVVIEGGIVTELRSRLLTGGIEHIRADELLFAEPALRAALAVEREKASARQDPALPLNPALPPDHEHQYRHPEDRGLMVEVRDLVKKGHSHHSAARIVAENAAGPADNLTKGQRDERNRKIAPVAERLRKRLGVEAKEAKEREERQRNEGRSP